jgi:putative membrane protein
MKKIFSIVIATCLAATIAKAQAPDPDTTAKHFLIIASISNLQEVNAGKQASQKAIRQDVKEFGKMMVTDHSIGEQKLLQLAKTKRYNLPAAATATPPYDLNMEKATGDEFDRMYIHAMVSGHRSTVMMFQNYAISGKDPDVKAFAQQMLPTLKEHLAAIKALDDKYKTLAAQ